MVKSQMSAALVLAGVALALTGCQSSRIGALDTRPAPLTPAPTGTVSQSQLPPPAQPQIATAPQPSFPDAPVTNTPVVQTPTIETPTVETPSVQPVASAQPVTREALVGAWKVTTAGSSCQMFMALTQWTGGYRAASRGCPGDAANVSAWDVQGQQVVLSDSSGNKVATLFASGTGRYDGQTTGGRAISLSR